MQSAKVILNCSYLQDSETEKVGAEEAFQTDQVVTGELTTVTLVGQDVSPNVIAQNNPIRVYSDTANSSFERVIRLRFHAKQTDGEGDPIATQNYLQNFKIWQSSATPSTACTLYYKIEETYIQPDDFTGQDVSTVKTAADTVGVDYAQIPTSAPGTANITIGGSITYVDTDGVGRLDRDVDPVAEYTDYIYLLLIVDSAQTVGQSQTIYVSYDEVS